MRRRESRYKLDIITNAEMARCRLFTEIQRPIHPGGGRCEGHETYYERMDSITNKTYKPFCIVDYMNHDVKINENFAKLYKECVKNIFPVIEAEYRLLLYISLIKASMETSSRNEDVTEYIGKYYAYNCEEFMDVLFKDDYKIDINMFDSHHLDWCCNVYLKNGIKSVMVKDMIQDQLTDETDYIDLEVKFKIEAYHTEMSKQSADSIRSTFNFDFK